MSSTTLSVEKTEERISETVDKAIGITHFTNREKINWKKKWMESHGINKKFKIHDLRVLEGEKKEGDTKKYLKR